MRANDLQGPPPSGRNLHARFYEARSEKLGLYGGGGLDVAFRISTAHPVSPNGVLLALQKHGRGGFKHACAQFQRAPCKNFLPTRHVAPVEGQQLLLESRREG